MIAGHQVFVCDNTAYNGEIIQHYRHTKNIEIMLPGLVSKVVRDAEQQFEGDVRLKLAMIERQISHAEGHTLLHRLYKNEVLSAAGGPKKSPFGMAIKEWDSPSFGCFTDRNLWSLFNACTFGTSRNFDMKNHLVTSNKLTAAFTEIVEGA